MSTLFHFKCYNHRTYKNEDFLSDSYPADRIDSFTDGT
jgi:hypothetical protein